MITETRFFYDHFKVYICDFLCIQQVWKQYRFQRSKKARIRKKWAKKSDNFKSETVHKAIKVGDSVYVSSEVFEKLKQKLQ